MHSHREPQIAGSTQREAKKQRDRTSSKRSEPGFAWIRVMHQGKDCGEQQHSRPEPRDLLNCELGKSAKCELLENSDTQEECSPEQRKLPDVVPMQNQAPV